MANLLPPNSTPLERNLASVTSALGDLPAPLRDLVNPDTCPAKFLPWLASWLSVDAWDDAWTEAQKRAVIKSSIRVHQTKGTVASVRAVLEAAGVDVNLVEWWQEQPRGTPHTFRLDVEVTDRGLDENTLDSIERQVTSVKPVRSHFTTRLIGKTKGRLYLGAVTFSGEVTEVLPHTLTEVEGPHALLRLGAGWSAHCITTVFPQEA